jgi:hypothetical protein
LLPFYIDIDKAIENREKFLAPEKEKFIKSKSKHERSKIISYLIEIEPSHLTEPWVLKEVVNWMRDRRYFDFLEEAFIQAPKKYAPTEQKEIDQARDLFVLHAIDRIKAEKKVSERQACELFVLEIPDMNNIFHTFYPNDPKRALEAEEKSDFKGDKYLKWDITEKTQDQELGSLVRRVYRDAKNQPDRFLPWPYYGKDVEIDENGNVTIFGGR